MMRTPDSHTLMGLVPTTEDFDFRRGFRVRGVQIPTPNWFNQIWKPAPLWWIRVYLCYLYLLRNYPVWSDDLPSL
jgi:hypothetical protein